MTMTHSHQHRSLVCLCIWLSRASFILYIAYGSGVHIDCFLNVCINGVCLLEYDLKAYLTYIQASILTHLKYSLQPVQNDSRGTPSQNVTSHKKNRLAGVERGLGRRWDLLLLVLLSQLLSGCYLQFVT